jgi:hypothetical protein
MLVPSQFRVTVSSLSSVPDPRVQVRVQDPSPFRTPAPVVAPGPGPLHTGIRTHTVAKGMSADDTERLDKRYSGTSVWVEWFVTRAMDWATNKTGGTKAPEKYAHRRCNTIIQAL